jgi:hypothetical protein
MWIGVQIAAMLTMLIDHVGYLFFKEEQLFRWIGRIAFPLYTFGIVIGNRHTSDRKKYVRRLFLLALLSQLPFMLAFRTYELNVIFTLIFSLLTLWALDHYRSPVARTIVVACILFVTFVVPMDYGWYGVILTLIYRYTEKGQMIWSHLVLNVFYCLLAWNYIQMFSILPTVFIAYWPQWLQRGRKAVPVWLWRSFYPAHLAVLGVLYLVITY